jgi:hypothetical protein
MKEKSLTPGEAAELIDVSRKTPRHWRHTGYGPPLSKSKGRKIRCPEGPLQAWIRCHTRFPHGVTDGASPVERPQILVA